MMIRVWPRITATPLESMAWGVMASPAARMASGIPGTRRLEYAKSGLRINAVCPGAVETESLAGYFRENPAVKQGLVAGHPIGRLGTPEEVANAVLWLCADEARFMIGQSLLLDGGYTAQ